LIRNYLKIHCDILKSAQKKNIFAAYLITQMKLNSTLVILCLVTVLTNAQAQPDPSTTMFRFQSSVTNNTADLRYKPVDNLLWKFKTDGKIFSSPVLSVGVVLIGSEDKNLYAIDSKTGELKWKFKTGGAVHSSPAVCDNTVFLEAVMVALCR